MAKDLTISIVSTGEAHVLDKCLHLIFSGTSVSVSYEVVVVNNDCGLEISNMLKLKHPQVKVIENSRRMGYAENHNQVISKSSAEFVLIMNPDIFIEKGFVETLISALRADDKIGVAMGKLLRNQTEAVIDSTGIVILKSRRSVDRGQGEKDAGQYEIQGEIFSASGAAMLCRRKMLDDVRIGGDYLDSSFKLYKEELDLCWRARLLGWKIEYVPAARARHIRGWGTNKKRASVPGWIRRESYKNRYLMMIKNDHFINILRDFPFLIAHEISAFFYAVFREPDLFLAWPQILWLLPSTMKKRHEIMKRSVIGPEEIRKWFK